MSKRKRVVLTLNDKINIIESLKKGETGRTLATKYGVGTSTISDIKKNTDSILKFTCKLNKDKSIHRKAMKKPSNELLEEALYRWYLQKRSTGHPISGPLICKKALQFNKKISGNKSFVASSGWLHRFKTRYGINDLQIHSSKISDNLANSAEDSFREELIENEYDLNFVYNAAETKLYWKLLPSKAFLSWKKNSALANKINEERVTLLVCANATGTHKLPLLLIGKLKNPTCFKNIKIPLHYNNQHNACMDTEIFLDWYDSIFIPEVKKYQNQIGKHGNVLLLLNNTSIHPSAISLERENGIFNVKLLSSNMSSLSQPMNSVIITLKRLYRKQFLRRLLSVNDENTEISFAFFKQMNLKECCYILVDAWDLIKRNILIKAWNTILKQEDRDYVSNTDDSILEDIYKLIPNIRICEKCDADDIKAWLDCEITDQEFQVMSDDEIIKSVQQIHGQKEIKEEETEEKLSVENNEVPSHEEAFHALETAFKWYERQTECDTVSLLQLKRILDLAAIKRKNYTNCLYEVTIKNQIKLE